MRTFFTSFVVFLAAIAVLPAQKRSITEKDLWDFVCHRQSAPEYEVAPKEEVSIKRESTELKPAKPPR